MELENRVELDPVASGKISGASEKNHARFLIGAQASGLGPKEKIEWDPDQPGLGRRFRAGSRRGTWVVQWRCEGRSLRRSIGSTQHMSRDAAVVIAQQLRHPDPDAPPLRLAPSPTLAAFIETFQRDCAARWKPATRAAIRLLCAHHLVPAFGNRRVDAITSSEVVAWFESKKSSANWCLSLLSSLMLHAETLGLRPDNSNPCAGLRRKKSGFNARYPTAEDYQRIGQAMAGGSVEFRRSVPIIRFLALTGARKGEALALRWTHFHDDRFVLPDSKTGPKTIWLPRAARALLKRTRQRRTSPYVFGVSDRAQAVRELDATWKQIRTETGLREMRLHDLRHGFASVAVTQGIELRVIAGLLGHADFTTTLGYAHLAQGHLSAAADRVSRHLASAIGSSDAEQGADKESRPVLVPKPVPVVTGPRRLKREVERYYAITTIDPDDLETPKEFCARNQLDFPGFKLAMGRYRKRHGRKQRRGIQR
ncbi:MAG: tyrosine-type recombinase/integrase [Panacagrimonas sp.]